MPYELPIPEFLTETEEEIHQRMLEKAPPGISTKEGDFFWDATRPAAIEKAQLVQLQMPALMRLFFVQTSYGQYLDYLGQPRGVTRLKATPATGDIHFTGSPGTVISEGSVIATLAIGNAPAIMFETTEEAIIDGEGEATARARCAEPGTTGNVPAGVIVLMADPIEGITDVVNPEPFTGGTEIEEDDAFRQRILEAVRLPATSGNMHHYKMWAKEVPGIGDAKVFPLWDGPGTVKVVVIDGNKRAASPELVDAVAAHIEIERPIGADVTVAAAVEKEVSITADITLAHGYAIDQVQPLYEEAVTEYLKSIAFIEVYVSYAQLGKILLETTGVGDYANLEINGSASNVLLEDEETPVMGIVTLGCDGA
ncbi:MAG TPA: baseplate J/gp47 family protein [Firmicutes bacterium]|nr:baseplate J/gp47 family protein [Bacillota bacterium]